MPATRRGVALLVMVLAVVVAPHLKADAVLLTDNYGVGTISSPPYYVGGPGTYYSISAPSPVTTLPYYELLICSGAPCGTGNGIPSSIATDSIPATVYVGNPHGYVSDKLITSTTPMQFYDSSGAPLLVGVALDFIFTFGLDLTGPPLPCASVGGCAFTYDASVQTVGTLTWASGGSTTLLFQYNTPEPGTLLTCTLGLAAACAFGIRRRKQPLVS